MFYLNLQNTIIKNILRRLTEFPTRTMILLATGLTVTKIHFLSMTTVRLGTAAAAAATTTTAENYTELELKRDGDSDNNSTTGYTGMPRNPQRYATAVTTATDSDAADYCFGNLDAGGNSSIGSVATAASATTTATASSSSVVA